MDFTFYFSVEHLRHSLHRISNHEEWFEALTDALPQYDISTPERVAAFMAQCAHESGGFTALKENLNYSAQGLMGVFKKYFPTQDLANAYARQPEKIANRVYANRMGNGSEQSGDGWRYRGRGLIQLTGKSNYTRCSEYLFEDHTLVDKPEVVEQPYYAIHTACWFWTANGINYWADSGNIEKMTRVINGGTNGLADRIKHYQEFLELFHTS